jgi:hypothetical protein
VEHKKAAKEAIRKMQPLLEPSEDKGEISFHRTIIQCFSAVGISLDDEDSNSDNDESDVIFKLTDATERSEFIETGHAVITSTFAAAEKFHLLCRMCDLYCGTGNMHRCLSLVRQSAACQPGYGVNNRDKLVRKLVQSASNRCKQKGCNFQDKVGTDMREISEEAIEFLNEVASIDEFLWTQLIDQWRRSDLQKAEGVLQRMEKVGVQADTVTYTTLLDGYIL